MGPIWGRRGSGRRIVLSQAAQEVAQLALLDGRQTLESGRRAADAFQQLLAQAGARGG
jgi:hypothetical protein